MADKSVLIKDGALTGALTVTASSTTYSTGINLDSQESSLLDLSLVVELSDRASSASVIFELMGDSALPVDASSATVYTGEAVVVDGNVILPVPNDFAYKYVGVKCTESAGGTYTANTFLNVPKK
jgi:hypothetical protein